jgi:TolB-like protein/Flp pilus assembly protein TadD
MASLFQELKRRNVYRVALAYLILGWLVLQITDIVAPALRLPDWTMSLVIYLGVIGFPFALLFAWAFELTPEGLRRTSEVSQDSSITAETGKSLNRAIMGLMALAILLLLADRFYTSLSSVGEAGMAATETAVGTGSAEVAAREGPKSIAVLPFVNMSDDPAQEYFSDGISEELLNGLAKIRELRVAARTSSFAFKGQNQDIKNIGEQLNVDTVLEGSVRKAGPRIRITAQLISVDDGYHLWSEVYDRELNDIFAIQDEISQAIVDALKVHLMDGESVASHREVDLDAYNFYLLARHSLRRRTEKSLQLAEQQYQKAIDIDPTYAEAWAGKATATELLSEQHYGSKGIKESRQKAQAMLDMAFSLDPDLPEAHATQALLYLNHEQPHEALVHVDAAIQGIPSEGILYAWRSSILSELGRYNDAAASEQHAYRIDPLHQTIRHNVAGQQATFGNPAVAREMMAPGSDMAYEMESWIAQRDGRWADAARALESAIEQAEGGYDLRLAFLAVANYFFNLQATEAAQAHARGTSLYLIQTFSDPVAALPVLEQIPEGRRSRFTRNMTAYSLMYQDRCEEMLALFADDKLLEQPVWGNTMDGGNRLTVLTRYAWCLRETGREAEAAELAGRIMAYIDQSIANGQPPTYFNQLAEAQIILGEKDAALASLKQAWQHYWLSWVDFDSPMFRELRQEADFLALRQAVYERMNAERARLDLEPLELAALQ